MVSVVANPSPQPSPKGRGRLEHREGDVGYRQCFGASPAVRKFRILTLVLSFDRFDLSHAFAMTIFGDFG